MDKQTLSNYGWVVIVTLILAVMLAFATPFGNFIGDGVVAVANGFFELNTKATDEDNIDKLSNKWENKLDTQNPNGVIPDGGTYTQPDGDEFEGGEDFPEDITDGDTFVYGQYKYTYNYRWGTVIADGMIHDNTLNGWHAQVIDNTLSEYDNMLESINGKPIASVGRAYFNCQNMKQIPKIPNTVSDMAYAFQNCSSLTGKPMSYIPEKTINMAGIFSGCKNITEAPSMSKAKNVQHMADAFRNCEKLVVPPTIPNGVWHIASIFWGCKSLTYVPEIPDTVLDMSNAFRNCEKLQSAPVIPANVSDLDYAFANCYNLTGTVTIHANPLLHEGCFSLDKMGKDITLVGNTPSYKYQILIDTSTTGYRTIYDASGTIVKQ